MAAESLARRAFPRQPQLWRVWSRGTRRIDAAVLGRTVGGYLLRADRARARRALLLRDEPLARLVAALRVLTDPNILSSAVPALMPIAVSLQAGFMEECLFRAVPLALGALIGARFGRAHDRDRRRVRAAGAGLRRGARQLPRLSCVFAAGRARRAVDALGGDLPALRPAADDPAARALRPCRCSRSRCSSSTRREPGHSALLVFAAGLVPLGDRCVAARERGQMGRVARQRCGTARGCLRRRRSARRAAALDHRLAHPGLRAERAAVCRCSRASPPGWRLHADAAPTSLRLRSIVRPPNPRGSRGTRGARRDLGPEWRRFSAVRHRERRRAVDAASIRVARSGRRTPIARSSAATLAPPLWEVRYRHVRRRRRGTREEWRVTIEPDGKVRQDPAIPTRGAARCAPFQGRGARAR